MDSQGFPSLSQCAGPAFGIFGCAPRRLYSCQFCRRPPKSLPQAMVVRPRPGALFSTPVAKRFNCYWLRTRSLVLFRLTLTFCFRGFSHVFLTFALIERPAKSCVPPIHSPPLLFLFPQSLRARVISLSRRREFLPRKVFYAELLLFLPFPPPVSRLTAITHPLSRF